MPLHGAFGVQSELNSSNLKRACVKCLGLPFFFNHLISSLVLVSRAQIESCDVSPESYFFKNGSFTHADNLLSSCMSSTKQSETYLTCSQASINDGNTGPQNFNDSSPADYYNWNNDLNQIEFRFSQNISFTRFKFFFYVNQNSKIALPKLRLLLLMKDDNLECTSNNAVFESFINDVRPDELAEGLHVMEKNLNGSVNLILLCILPSKRYTLALTEIQFCTTGKLAVIHFKQQINRYIIPHSTI